MSKPFPPLHDAAGDRRERIASAALGALLTGQAMRGDVSNSSADHLARRAVRYADALLEALNTSTARQLGQREPSPYHME